ncbi:MAG: hypothetical protein CSA81_12315 [Acidobacteria bacterium]|nr:MAG: hypothetical protein CSA81_12315 [Acidobacteriota bacterium]
MLEDFKMEWIQSNWTTVLIGLVLLLVVFKGVIVGKIFGIGNLSVAELSSMLADNPENTVLIDVRSKSETESGVIDHAMLIPLGDLSAQVNSLKAHQGKNMAVICASGTRSLMGAATLKKAGFKRVYNVSGGISAWRRHGFKLTKP